MSDELIEQIEMDLIDKGIKNEIIFRHIGLMHNHLDSLQEADLGEEYNCQVHCLRNLLIELTYLYEHLT